MTHNNEALVSTFHTGFYFAFYFSIFIIMSFTAIFATYLRLWSQMWVDVKPYLPYILPPFVVLILQFFDSCLETYVGVEPFTRPISNSTSSLPTYRPEQTFYFASMFTMFIAYVFCLGDLPFHPMLLFPPDGFLFGCIWFFVWPLFEEALWNTPQFGPFSFLYGYTSSFMTSLFITYWAVRLVRKLDDWRFLVVTSTVFYSYECLCWMYYVGSRRVLRLARYRARLAYLVCSRKPSIHGDYRWRDLQRRYDSKPTFGCLWVLSNSDLASFVSSYSLPPLVMFDQWKGRMSPEKLVPLIVHGRVRAHAIYLRRSRPVIHGLKDFPIGLDDLLRTFQIGYHDEHISTFVSFLYEVLRLYHNTDNISRALSLGAILLHPMVGLVGESGSKIVDDLKRLMDVPEIDGLSDHLDSLFSLNVALSGLKTSPVIVSLFALCAAFWQTTAYKRLGVGKGEFALWCAEIATSLSGDASFVSRLLEFLSQLVKRLRVAWESGDIYDLIGTSAFVAWTNEVAAERVLVDNLRLHLVPYDLLAGLARIKALRIAGDGFMAQNRSCSYYYTTVLAMEKVVNSCLSTVRDAPLGLIMVGPPGCGKTTLMETIENIVRKRYGLPDGNITHFYTDNTTHQEVEGIPAIVAWNDCLTTKDDKSNVNTLEFLQQMVDTAPMRFNGATLEAKANSLVEPRVVVLTTNERSYQFSKSTGGADKLDRRYLIIRVRFRKAAVVAAAKLGVKVSRLLQTENRIDPTWLKWTVGYMENEPGNQVIFKPVQGSPQFETFESLVSYLNFLFEEHDAKTARKKASISSSACVAGIKVAHDCSLCVPYKKSPPLPIPVTTEPDSDPDIQGLSFRTVVDWVPKVPNPERIGDIISFLSLGFGYALGFDYIVPILFCVAAFFRAFYGPLSYNDASGKGMLSNLLLLSVLAYRGHSLVAVLLVLCWPRDAFLCRFQLFWIYSTRAFDLYCFRSAPISYVLIKGGSLLGLKIRSCKSWHLLGSALLGLGAFLVMTKLALSVHGSVLGMPLNEEPTFNPVYPAAGFGVRAFTHVLPARIGVSRPNSRTKGTVLSPIAVLLPRHFFYPVKGLDVVPVQRGEKWNIHYEGVDYPQVFNPDAVAFPSSDSDYVVVRVTNFTKCPYAEVKMHAAAPGDPLFSGNFGTALAEPCRDYPYSMLTNLLPLTKGDCGSPIVDPNGCLVGIYAGAWGSRSMIQLVPQDIFSFIPSIHGVPANRYSSKLPHIPRQQGLHSLSDAGWMSKRDPLSIPFTVLGHETSNRTTTFTGCEALGKAAFESGLSEPYVQPRRKAYDFGNGWVSLTTRKFEAASDTKGFYDASIMDAVVDSYVARFPVPSLRYGFLTRHQVVVGCQESTYVSGRDPSKAVGPGLARQGIVAKTAVEQLDPTTYLVSKPLVAMWDAYDSEVNSGRVPLIEAKCVIKDELIPESKLIKGGGRYFTVIDLAPNLALKQALGNLISCVLQNVTSSFCFGGINAGSGAQWTALQNFLSDNGKRERVLGADHSTFDTRHNAIKVAVHSFYCKLAARLGYTPAEIRKMSIILDSFFWMELEIEGNFYLVEHMLASGRVDTVIFNSVSNALIFGYVYAVMRITIDGVPCGDVFSDLRLGLVGDDSCATVSPQYEDVYPSFLVRVGAELGYKITSATDKNYLPTFVPFSELTFLKRSFVCDAGVWKAPLAQESIFKMMCYVVELEIAPEERMVSAALCAQRESYLHGLVFYTEIQQRLDELTRLTGFPIPRLTFELLDEEFRSELLRLW